MFDLLQDKKQYRKRKAQRLPPEARKEPELPAEADSSVGDVVSHEALRKEIETDALLEAAQRLQEHDEKQRQERAAAVSSGTQKNKKKSQPAGERAAREVTLVPPVPSRSTRTPGGALKPQGVVFRALYDRSDLLCNTMAVLGKFYNLMPLTFTARGLEISALDSVHMMYARMLVPTTSFVCYDNLQEEAVEVCVSTKAVERVSRMSSKNTSMSFMYDQYGSSDEVLHLMYYPRTEKNANEQCIRTSFRGSLNEFEPLNPDTSYQYRVFVPGALFYKNVKHLADDASVISLMLSDSAFEMAAVSEEAVATTSFTMGAVHKERLPHDPLAEQNMLQCADAQTAANCCLIERLPEAEGSGVSMAVLRGFKLSSRYLYRAMRFVQGSGCERVSLRFGAAADEGSASGFSVNPLALLFEMRSPESGAQFSVELWIVPKMTE